MFSVGLFAVLWSEGMHISLQELKWNFGLKISVDVNRVKISPSYLADSAIRILASAKIMVSGDAITLCSLFEV